MYIALDKANNIDGYMLIYTGLEHPSVIFEGNPKTTPFLLKRLSINKMIIPHIKEEASIFIQETFPNAIFYTLMRMVVNRSQLNQIINSCYAKKLSINDAEHIARLFKEDTEEKIEKYANILRKFVFYGLFKDEILVSSAQALIQLPKVWIIGGVYTLPAYRNKGYATQVTFKLTEEALDKASSVGLYVNIDNPAAIKIYEKIGFKKGEERLWVDIGTGMKP
jgi:predicted GNAT family acetyltransferase